MALGITIGDPVSTTITAVSNAIASIAQVINTLNTAATDAEKQAVIANFLELTAPFNAIIKKLNDKLHIDPLQTASTPPKGT
jgi:hypothetical protein